MPWPWQYRSLLARSEAVNAILQAERDRAKNLLEVRHRQYEATWMRAERLEQEVEELRNGGNGYGP